jgi:hypothetical protein
VARAAADPGFNRRAGRSGRTCLRNCSRTSPRRTASGK